MGKASTAKKGAEGTIPGMGKAGDAGATWEPIESIRPWLDNPRVNDDVVPLIVDSMRAFGFGAPIIVRKDGEIIAGHTRLKAAIVLGLPVVLVRRMPWLSDDEAHELALADNKLGEKAKWDPAGVLAVIQKLDERRRELLGFGKPDVDALLRSIKDEQLKQDPGALQRTFGVPPFSVLDARQGYWQERKRAWLSLGIKSEVGRGDNLLGMSDTVLGKNKPETASRKGGLTFGTTLHPYDEHGKKKNERFDWTGTSIFDPVICELAYRWFSAPGAVVLDPFAGGSVRGVVAGALGRRYVGIDLRQEQILANGAQWQTIAPVLQGAAVEARAAAEDHHPMMTADPDALTPVTFDEATGVWLKRDDLFAFNGVRGSKGRALAKILARGGIKGLTTAGNRLSAMMSRVARAGEAHGLPVRCHCSSAKEESDQQRDAVEHGAELVRHKVGYLNALLGKARKDADERGWLFVPLGVEGSDYIASTRRQAANIPPAARRLVVVVGSGNALAAILHGLDDAGLGAMPVLGVRIGKDPTETLDKWAPANWRDRVTFVTSSLAYEDAPPETRAWGVDLEPHYEAKAIPFVEPYDVFWVVAASSAEQTPVTSIATSSRRTDPPPIMAPAWACGDSAKLLDPRHRAPDDPTSGILTPTMRTISDEDVDMVFSCPPYADLEVYSDDPRDLSAMPASDFDRAYRRIIQLACDRLKRDRFAVWVIGDVRSKAGVYRDLVSMTIAAFRDAGLELYNEAILITAVGSLAMRAGRIFPSARKLGKAHQQVLVFVKGNPQKAAEWCGPIEVTMPLPDDE